MPTKNRRSKVVGGASQVDDGDVTDESFRNANMSLMPDEVDDSKMAAVMPNMKIKAEMQPATLKVLNRPLSSLNKVQANLKDGDLHKLANAVTVEVNQMAAQLFELISMLNEVIAQKPKKVFKNLANAYQKRVE